jgi:hypothetical protein
VIEQLHPKPSYSFVINVNAVTLGEVQERTAHVVQGCVKRLGSEVAQRYRQVRCVSELRRRDCAAFKRPDQRVDFFVVAKIADFQRRQS